MKDFNSIKLLILDNDGVLTDGSIIYDDQKIESKNFSAKDGLGIRLWQQANLQLAVISGRSSNVLTRRCSDLGIDHLYQGVRNKLQKTRELLKELSLDWRNVAYLGDDWNDFSAMKYCEISAVPADSFPDIQEKVDIVLTRNGGKGAVREFIELILKKKGILDESINSFIQKLDSF